MKKIVEEPFIFTIYFDDNRNILIKATASQHQTQDLQHKRQDSPTVRR